MLKIDNSGARHYCPRRSTNPHVLTTEGKEYMAVQVILSAVGPLPVKATFNAPGDMPMYIEVNGSIWTQTANQMIGINIDLDGTIIGTAQIFSNGASTHRAVVPAWVPVKLTQGQHTLTLSSASATVSDSNDSFVVVLHY